jgi:hypothetical protein
MAENPLSSPKWLWILKALPAPNGKALQATLDRETDLKAKTASPADFVNASCFKPIEKAA